MDFAVNIRQCQREYVDKLLEWTILEGWTLSKVDCEVCLYVDTKGLLVAEDVSAAPVGFIGLFETAPDVIYIDCFIVREDLRGKGIGRKLWATMLERTSGKTLVLDSVSKVKSWYLKQGFKYETFTSRLFTGTINQTPVAGKAVNRTCDVVQLSQEYFPALLEYDKEIFPYSREKELRAWFAIAGIYNLVALKDGCVVGYANLHWKSPSECIIRALFADDKGVTDALLAGLLKKIPVGSMVMFEMAEGKELPECFSTFKRGYSLHRLCTKPFPPIKTSAVVIMNCTV